MTDSNENYNGWSNYETWCVNLWLTNDQGIYNYMLELAESCIVEDTKFEPLYEMQDKIKVFVAENNPLADNASMYTDLLNNALNSVNYREIAKHFIEQANEYEIS